VDLNTSKNNRVGLGLGPSLFQLLHDCRKANKLGKAEICPTIFNIGWAGLMAAMDVILRCQCDEESAVAAMLLIVDTSWLKF